MKILLYKDKSIIFKSPSEIKYKNIFQSKIYEFFMRNYLIKETIKFILTPIKFLIKN